MHRVDGVRSPGAEDRLVGDSGDVVGGEREVGDAPDLVVVDALGDHHGEGGEDARLGQAGDGRRLHFAQVLAAVVDVRLQVEPIELEVDLDAVAKVVQRGQEPVAAGDADAVRVEQHSGHVALDGCLDDLDDLRMNGRLAAGQHENIDLAALALDRG